MLRRTYIFAAAVAVLLGTAGGVWAGGTRGGAGAGTRGGAAGTAGALDAPTVKGNVSLQLPKGWTDVGGPTLIVAQPPAADKDATGQYQAALSVSQDVGNKVDGAAQQAALAKALQGYQVIEKPTPVTIGGLQGVMFGGSFKRGGVELRSRQYMFAVNNQVFTITFTSLSSKWAGYEGLVATSVGTFAVKK
jgi:hypothetical protein